MLIIIEINQVEKQLNKRTMQLFEQLSDSERVADSRHILNINTLKQSVKDVLVTPGDCDYQQIIHEYCKDMTMVQTRLFLFECYAELLALIHFARMVSWESNGAQAPFLNVRLVSKNLPTLRPIDIDEQQHCNLSYNKIYDELLLRREVDTPGNIEALVNSLKPEAATA